MTGSSVFEYVHTQDHEELTDHLGLGCSSSDGRTTPSSEESSPPPSTGTSSSPLPEKVSVMLHDAKKGPERSFCLRMKSTLTKRGVHVRTSGYRVVYIVGHMRPQLSFQPMNSGKECPEILGFVGLAIALPPPTITELRIERDTFIMRLSPEFKIIYCDALISQLTEWTSDEMSSFSFYDFCHPGDLKHLQSSHFDLISKGQVLTNYFRLLNKGCGYVWAQMCATTLFSSKTSEEHTTLAIIYVLSGIESRSCAMVQNEAQEVHNSSQTNKTSVKKDEVKEYLNEISEFSPAKTSTTVQQTTNASVIEERLTVNHTNKTSGEVTCIVDANIQQEGGNNVQKEGTKFSRRKMEKPRKRKREYDNNEMDNVMFSSKNERLSEILEDEKVEFHLDSLCQKQKSSHDISSNQPSPKSTLCSSPEDLTVSNTFIKNGNYSTSSISENNHVLTQSLSNHLPQWKPSSSKTNGVSDNKLSPSSVKDLENMVKHLPKNGERIFKSGSENDISDTRIINGQVTKIRPSQWHSENNDRTDPHPASNLLRSLYANRESVIRSSISRPQCFSTSPCEALDSVDMLTPPANEDTLKEPLTLSIPQINVSRDKGLAPNGYNNMNNLHVTVVNKGVSNSYDITPPSSASPQDKQMVYMESGFELDSSNSHHPHHCHIESSMLSPSLSKSVPFSHSVSNGIYNDFPGSSNKYTNNMTSSSYQSIPSYQHQLYNSGMNPVVVYDKRSEIWYPISYSS